MKKILYVQYTDPSAWPPIGHSSLLLAGRGWHVRHLGIAAAGAASALATPKHPALSSTLMRRPGGGLDTILHYARFFVWCRSEILRWRPDVVYCSDVRSYPVGLWASRQREIKTVLHEHDPPPRTGGARVMQALRAIRTHFAKRASLIVIPQAERARAFLADTGADPARLHVVFNCPSVRELSDLPSRPDNADRPLVLWYHGILGASLLPLTIVDALARLPEDVTLEVAGYETVSTKGYVGELLARARDQGLAERVWVHGVLSRSDLLRAASMADIGLALFTKQFPYPLVGASNKPFDYLACGLPLLTNRTAEWQDFFGAEGVSIGCDPDDPDDIARAVRALYDDPERRRKMAETGRHLIETKWNYEAQFAGVLDAIEARILL